MNFDGAREANRFAGQPLDAGSESQVVTLNSFGINEGFPTKGFASAQFALKVSGNNAGLYTWSGSQSWVSVNASGVVTFTGVGTGDEVTITGVPKSGLGDNLEYKFKLKDWFTNKGNQTMTWSTANMTCTLPSRSELSRQQKVRDIGSLYSEWGDMSTYDGSGFVGNRYWASEQSSGGTHYHVNLGNGVIYNYNGTNSHYVVCRQGL